MQVAATCQLLRIEEHLRPETQTTNPAELGKQMTMHKK
jgi:hypothetical protein